MSERGRRAGREREENVEFFFLDVGGQPADDTPRRGFKPGFRAVFAFETELHDFKLQRTDGGKQRCFYRGIAEIQRLDDSFLQQLVEALAKLFVFPSVRIVQIRKRLGREAWDFLVKNFGIGRQRVADAKTVVADEADDVTGVRFVHRLAFVAKQFVRAGETNFFLGARMMDGHVAVELLAGADADERDAQQ